jgi:Protein of unknown function (DUF1573)
MSDDFGTMNIRRGPEQAREIEVLRRHYRQHREALSRMMADAPTDHLATEYERLAAEIDRALAKLDELDNLATAPAFVPPPPPPPQHERPVGDPALRSRTEPGLRPLATNPAVAQYDDGAAAMEGSGPRSRVALILGIAVIALGLISWLIWRASSDRTPERPVVASATSTAPIATQSDVAAADPVASAELTVTPTAHDYGTIRKGTRATRQYELANNTDDPITVQVARSACRCLYYEHAPVVPPRAKEMLTVTIDGARAKAGPLSEDVKIASKSDPSVAASIEVTATVR